MAEEEFETAPSEASGQTSPEPPTEVSPAVGTGPASTGQPATDPPTAPIVLPPTTPPAGSYALGALAGNPLLGGSPGGGDPAALAGAAGGVGGTVGYGGGYDPPVFLPPPPAGPSSGWGAPPPPPPPSGARGVARAMVGGGLALVLLGGGMAIGYAAWSAPSRIVAAPPSFNHIPANPFYGNGGGNGGGGNNGGNFNPFGGSSGGSSVGAGPADSASIASKVDPGLVDINTTLGYQGAEAAGTGIVLTSNGEILTNNHVIEGATSISATDVGNHKTYTASVVGYSRSKDVAVLQLHGASGLQTASLGNSDNVAVGQQVVGVGNAGGTGGTPSYAGGAVTAVNQSITASDQADGSSEQLTGLIQTNANIQEGDSGGPLVNTSGQVIGMDTAASAGFNFQTSGNEGFSIPINTATDVARQIESGQASSTVHIGETAFLGVQVQSVSGNNNGNGFFGGGGGGQSDTSGALIAGVVTSSPAQQAGLAQGDVITSMNGGAIGSADALTGAMLSHKPGDKVTIGWTDSSGSNHTANVTLTSGPPQ